MSDEPSLSSVRRIFPASAAPPRLLRDSSIVANSQWLKKVLGDADELEESLLRQFLDSDEAANWPAV